MTAPIAARGPADREFGAYRLHSELGRGGMGTVYVAVQRALGRAVALKVLSPAAAGERSLWRFRREAQLLAQLDHPGIVKILDSGHAQGQPFFAMELVEGASLADVLRDLGERGGAGVDGAAIRLAVQQREPVAASPKADAAAVAWRLPRDYQLAMAQIVAEVAEALASAHAASVVHRDVKPSNILIRRDGAVRVADFGIAHQQGVAAFTAAGDLAGTPSYMAPEQLRGSAVDHRTDVFALGVVLYEALTLQLPFSGKTVAARLAGLDEVAVPCQERAPAIGRDLAAVVAKAIEPAARDRYQTAGELALDLRAVVGGQPVLARRPGPLEALWRRARRRPWLLAAAAVATLALGTILGIDQVGRRQVAEETARTALALAELERLTIGVRLDRALATAAAFHVARFEDVPAMDRWLAEQGEPLVAELPRLEDLLREVRREALAYGDAERAEDRANHPSAAALERAEAELAFLERQVADGPAGEVLASRTAKVREARDGMLRQLADDRGWRFVAAERQFLHDQVTAVVRRLRAFVEGPTATVAHVAAQRAWALDSHRRCTVEAAAQWATVAAEVATDPRFAGLQLRPQRDLLPLQKDPHSGLWEFVHLRSGAPGQELPKRAEDGCLLPSEGMGIVLVLLPGGTFTMGAQSSEPAAPAFDPQAIGNEAPITQSVAPYFCGKYELTIAQWGRLAPGDSANALVGDALSKADPRRNPLQPADNVSLRRARSGLADHGLALPIGAQWEYACRAGTTTPFPFGGRERAAEFANFADAQARRNGSPSLDHDLDDGFPRHSPVGSFRPNGFGLHDTLGNVSELTEDLSTGRMPHQIPKAQAHLLRLPRFDDTLCIARGGNYLAPLLLLRASSRRELIGQDQAQQNIGIRVVRAIDS